jgi:glycosyltransferase involved in cell wall biosynthesis
MRKLKIAAYYNLPDGGAKKAIENILDGLKSRGHKVDVYTGEGFHPIELTKKYPIDNVLLPLNLWRYKKFSQKLASRINKEDYDVVIVSNSTILQHPYILRYLKFPKLLISQEPLRIAYERNFIENYVYKKYYRGIVMRIISLYSKLGILLREKPDRENLRKADRLIVNSYFSKENFLANYGVLGKVLYLGVDTKIFKPSSENERENCILSVGTYHAIKGHDLVIKALSFIPENKRPLLKILGFGSFGTSEKEFQYLNYLRDSLGLREKIKFEKNFFGNNIVKYYQKAYLTVAASFLEPFGFVPIESMACGTPVIAIKEGGFRETVKHEETGLLIERDPQELANAILYLIENKEVWKKFSENGINWVKSNFSWERTINEIEKELLDLAEK